MTNELMQETLKLHNITFTGFANRLMVAEDYTEYGVPGREWREMIPSEWTMKSLLIWLGY